MQFLSTLLVVADMERAKRFYQDVLAREIVQDFGANVTLTGGIALQTKDTWAAFIHKHASEIMFGGNAAELYFEEEDFDGFLQKLSAMTGIDRVHDVQEHAWGQRVVRFRDPDGHIIEVGESMRTVVQRFLRSGLSVAETAARMDVPTGYIEAMLRGQP